MRAHPRTLLLPYAAIGIPLALVNAAASPALYLTVFENRDYPIGGLFGIDEAGAPLFALLVLVAVTLLFSLVGQTAAVVAAAGTARGAPPTLSEALDPPFTRMGSLLVLGLVLVALSAVLVISLVGLIVLPYVLVRLGVSFQVFILEGRSPLQALGGSWRLMRGHMLRLIGIVLFAAIPVMIVSSLGSLTALAEESSRSVRMAVDGLGQVALGLLTVPVAVFAQTATTLYYLKIREGDREAS